VAVSRKVALVVEDNNDLRQLYRESLQYAGFDVCEASDGPQALRCIEQTPPDVIVLDIGLPTLDGVSVLEELAAHIDTRSIPIIVVTGQEVDEACLKPARVLRKPVLPSRLVATVRGAIASAGRTQREED
jgi:CheY-like chemotaxis protein